MAAEPANPTAVVTGASGGLGKAIAIALARHSVRVAAVARRSDRLEALVLDAGTGVYPFAADVTRREDVDALALAVRKTLGPVTVVVNAAGVFGPIATVEAGDPEEWIATIATNTIGPYLVCRAFVPDMLAAGWGRILNVTSAASLHPPGKLNSAYGTSKVALNQFTRHLAAELAGTGVTANVFHPGDVKTEMWSQITAQARAQGATEFVAWSEWVQETGGDPPSKAADLVLGQVLRGSDLSGEFLWIDDPLQAPIQAWDPPNEDQPWLT
jgi:NAD(P)-dependent dehydrogenase (short-subunit alcohol dehydrogenase family)